MSLILKTKLVGMEPELIDASNEIKYFITRMLNINIWNFRRLKQVVYENIWEHGSQ